MVAEEDEEGHEAAILVAALERRDCRDSDQADLEELSAIASVRGSGSGERLAHSLPRSVSGDFGTGDAGG